VRALRATAMAPAVVGGGRVRSNEPDSAAAAAKPPCVCGFPVCACTGSAAVASAASSLDMDIVAMGQIGPVNDESWVGVGLGEDGETDESGAAVDDRPVFRTEKIRGALLYPYRYVLTHHCSHLTGNLQARHHHESAKLLNNYTTALFVQQFDSPLRIVICAWPVCSCKDCQQVLGMVG